MSSEWRWGPRSRDGVSLEAARITCSESPGRDPLRFLRGAGHCSDIGGKKRTLMRSVSVEDMANRSAGVWSGSKGCFIEGHMGKTWKQRRDVVKIAKGHHGCLKCDGLMAEQMGRRAGEWEESRRSGVE